MLAVFHFANHMWNARILRNQTILKIVYHMTQTSFKPDATLVQTFKELELYDHKLREFWFLKTYMYL